MLPLPGFIFVVRIAWRVYLYITSTVWFESFVLLNIVLIGVSTGIDLENSQGDPNIQVNTPAPGQQQRLPESSLI